MLQIVPESMLGLAQDPAELNRSQSEFWGVPLTVSLAPRRSRRQTYWNYYAAGIMAGSAQAMLYPFGGAPVAAEVRRRLAEGPDLVFLDRVDAAMPFLRQRRPLSTVIMDVDDLYHKVLWRSAFGGAMRPGHWATALQAPALLLAERRAIAMSSCAFVCSEADRRHLRPLGLNAKIHVAPNGVEVPRSPPGLVADRTILFLGAFHHPPNAAAADRLVRRIWPLIHARVPDARLLIAGSHSERLAVGGALPSGVEILGFVDDLAALYARTRLVCCPISTGSGTRLKLVEAASYARPMVSTRVGAEGLDFADGAEILLRDNDRALAEACTDLLLDDGLCQRIGDAGRDAMIRLYEVTNIEQRIAETILATVSAAAGLKPALPH